MLTKKSDGVIEYRKELDLETPEEKGKLLVNRAIAGLAGGFAAQKLDRYFLGAKDDFTRVSKMVKELYGDEEKECMIGLLREAKDFVNKNMRYIKGWQKN